MKKPINVVCLKWGEKYSADLVNRLYRMTCKHLTVPFKFYCLTETAKGLDEGILHLPLESTDLVGWWYKLSLFKKEFFGLEGEILYFDLDVVITRNINFLVEQSGRFLICKNWSRNLMWNSSVMRFDVGQHADIWERFLEDKDKVLSSMNGDQEWIYHCRPNAEHWPQEKVVSYKKSLDSRAYAWLPKKMCLFLGLKATDKMDTPLPLDAAVVIFHGKPDPEDVINGPSGLWKKATFIQRAYQ